MTVTGAGTADVPPSARADTVLQRLTAAYGAAADPARAAAMRAYMKDVAPFLGIPTPERRALPEREYHYFAVDYLRRYAGRCSSAFLPVVRRLVTTVSWWDTVDLLAVRVVGPLVAADPRLTAEMDAWITDDDLWVARTALLHQLGYKDRTDTGRLFGYCLGQSGHPDFFVREAMSTALTPIVTPVTRGNRLSLDTRRTSWRSFRRCLGDQTSQTSLHPRLRMARSNRRCKASSRYCLISGVGCW
ncbi:DNA alkylation repair protein [Streptomyces galilaeus]|uniref:DNA alkylation repair protein n=1 Tax=Streptomyces galilaeus TaxID=33899 RepID=UPI0038F6FBA7